MKLKIVYKFIIFSIFISLSSEAFAYGWVQGYNGRYDRDAFRASVEYASELYICRARTRINGSWAVIPGKLHPAWRKCFYALNGREHSVSSYEVLVHRDTPRFRWRNPDYVSRRQLVRGGYEPGVGSVFLCLFRDPANHRNTPGKLIIDGNRKLCFIPLHGIEWLKTNFRVLTHY